LNLREALCGTCRCKEKYQLYKQPGNITCFIGRTVRKSGKGPVLATAGSEILHCLSGLPEAETYIAAMTPGYDIPGILPFFRTLEKVYSILLHSPNRQMYYRERTLGVSGREPVQELGPAARPTPIFENNSLHFETKNLDCAFYKILQLLDMTPEKDFDHDIFSRTVFQRSAGKACDSAGPLFEK